MKCATYLFLLALAGCGGGVEVATDACPHYGQIIDPSCVQPVPLPQSAKETEQ